MAHNLSIARPYAKAAFNEALAEQQFEQWSRALQTLVLITTDSQVQGLIHDPRVARAELERFILAVGQAHFSQTMQNFVRLLTEEKRLDLAPDIYQLFEQYVAEYHQSIDVQVISFKPLSAEQKANLTQALTKRLKRQVSLEFKEDPGLLGGAVIRANDLVIDGSLRHKLAKLKNQLVAA
jgi:F-type H+-transporting ATPase subunit delta